MVASVAILLTGFWRHAHTDVRIISQVALWLTGLGTAAVGLLFLPDLTDGRISRLLGGLRYVGPSLKRLAGAAQMYRRKPGVLVLAVVMSIGVHSFFTLGMYLIAIGVYQTTLPENLTLAIHFVICPISAATGVIPLCMGPLETVLSFLYAVVSGVKGAQVQGLVVALGYRIITVLIATIGFFYYLGSRREVTEVMHEAEKETHDRPDPTFLPPSACRARDAYTGRTQAATARSA